MGPFGFQIETRVTADYVEGLEAYFGEGAHRHDVWTHYTISLFRLWYK